VTIQRTTVYFLTRVIRM